MLHVIGISNYEFIEVLYATYMNTELGIVSQGIEKIKYNIRPSQATIFPDYQSAKDALCEIRKNSSDIQMLNDSIIDSIIDEQFGREFDVDSLKVYRLSAEVVVEIGDKVL